MKNNTTIIQNKQVIEFKKEIKYFINIYSIILIFSIFLSNFTYLIITNKTIISSSKYLFDSFYLYDWQYNLSNIIFTMLLVFLIWTITSMVISSLLKNKYSLNIQMDNIDKKESDIYFFTYMIYVISFLSYISFSMFSYNNSDLFKNIIYSQKTWNSWIVVENKSKYSENIKNDLNENLDIICYKYFYYNNKPTQDEINQEIALWNQENLILEDNIKNLNIINVINNAYNTWNTISIKKEKELFCLNKNNINIDIIDKINKSKNDFKETLK